LSKIVNKGETDRLAGMLERVQKMEAFLARIVASSAVGLVITNRQGEIVSCNDEIAQLFGYEPQQLHGKSIDLLIPM
jgi:PAS domain S-box-containing protein